MTTTGPTEELRHTADCIQRRFSYLKSQGPGHATISHLCGRKFRFTNDGEDNVVVSVTEGGAGSVQTRYGVNLAQGQSRTIEVDSGDVLMTLGTATLWSGDTGEQCH